MAPPRSLRQPLLLMCVLAMAATPGWSATAPVSAKAGMRARHHNVSRTAPMPHPTLTAPAARTGPGMVVGFDPETGSLGMPSRDDLLQLSSAERTGLLRMSAGLSPVRLPDGTLMIPLEGRFMDYSVVRRDASGRLRAGCVDDVRALARWFDTGAPVAAPIVEDR